MSRQNQNTPLLGNQGQPQRQPDPKLQHIQSQVNTAQGVMKDNIHLAIERGEKMNDLVCFFFFYNSFRFPLVGAAALSRP